jgi:hypothetical protein
MEISNKAVSSREFDRPVAVIAHVFRRALPNGLRNGAERRVGDHCWPVPVHPDELVAAHREGARNLSVQRAVGLLERDGGWLDAGDLADQGTKAGQIATGAAGEYSTQGL